MERVFSFIHSNSGNPAISLEKAASQAALSKYYFTRFFKEHTGQTFHTYLSQYRINRAKDYLAESDLPVTEIAYLCGFSSIKTFNRLFKTFAGVAPSTFRSGNKGMAEPPTIPDFIFS
jgi:AraC-like DNA-binding protein